MVSMSQGPSTAAAGPAVVEKVPQVEMLSLIRSTPEMVEVLVAFVLDR